LAYDASTDWESRLTITRGTKTGKKWWKVVVTKDDGGCWGRRMTTLMMIEWVAMGHHDDEQPIQIPSILDDRASYFYEENWDQHLCHNRILARWYVPWW
jgi:hypothetical protein